MLVQSLVISSVAAFVSQHPLIKDCSNYQGRDTCHGDQVSYPDSVEERRWQTPPKGHRSYKSDQWQNYGALQGYARLEYTQNHQEVAVTFVTFQRQGGDLEFQFGDSDWQRSPSKKFGADQTDEVVMTARFTDHPDIMLQLDPVYFVWQSKQVDAPHTQNGTRGAIVELFGWPYEEIEQECKHLGAAGYMGLKVWPPVEHVESDHYLQNGELNPWYFVYQPVSYKLQSRFGSRAQLRKMIQTCRSHNVRVYADSVVNHMTGGANDVLVHRRNDNGRCTFWGAKNSTANSPYFTHSWTFGVNEFTGKRPALEFPAVPYGPQDFHCERTLSDWNSGFSLNYGWLVGLTDLNTEREYVRQRIADHFTDLLSIGFSGFRIDAAKHIRPVDLAAILGKLRKNFGGKLPVDFLTWLEVIVGGERDLVACQYGDYNYYTFLTDKLREQGLSDSEVEAVKIWSSDYPKEHPICGNWVIPASRFAIQNDDHDQQNAGSSSRDMADKGSVLVKDRDVNKHRHFEVELFRRRDADWKIKLVLSGYSLMNSGAAGIPDGKSDCKNYKKNEFSQPGEQCKSVPFSKAYQEDACGYSVLKNGQWTEGVYTRVHRDRNIINAMRDWSGLPQSKNVGIPAGCQ